MSGTLVGAAPVWAHQPTAPPASPDRPLFTPAARASLKEAGIAGIEALGTSRRVIRLAEARRFIAEQTAGMRSDSQESATVSDAQSGDSGYWLSGEVLVATEDPAARAARVLRAVAGAMRTWKADPVTARVVVAGDDDPANWVRTRLDDVTGLDSRAIARRIANNFERTDHSYLSADSEGIDLELFEATGTTAARVRPPVAGSVIVALGCPQRRVLPITSNDVGTALTVALVAEVWVYSGDFGGPHAAMLFKAAQMALGEASS